MSNGLPENTKMTGKSFASLNSAKEPTRYMVALVLKNVRVCLIKTLILEWEIRSWVVLLVCRGGEMSGGVMGSQTGLSEMKSNRCARIVYSFIESKSVIMSTTNVFSNSVTILTIKPWLKWAYFPHFYLFPSKGLTLIIKIA